MTKPPNPTYRLRVLFSLDIDLSDPATRERFKAWAGGSGTVRDAANFVAMGAAEDTAAYLAENEFGVDIVQSQRIPWD